MIAEERCGQRCVNEAGGDEVDPDGGELDREVGCKGDASAAAAAGDLEDQHDVLVGGARACSRSMAMRRP